jgi:hypothetical protein
LEQRTKLPIDFTLEHSEDFRSNRTMRS